MKTIALKKILLGIAITLCIRSVQVSAQNLTVGFGYFAENFVDVLPAINKENTHVTRSGASFYVVTADKITDIKKILTDEYPRRVKDGNTDLIGAVRTVIQNIQSQSHELDVSEIIVFVLTDGINNVWAPNKTKERQLQDFEAFIQEASSYPIPIRIIPIEVRPGNKYDTNPNRAGMRELLILARNEPGNLHRLTDFSDASSALNVMLDSMAKNNIAAYHLMDVSGSLRHTQADQINAVADSVVKLSKGKEQVSYMPPAQNSLSGNGPAVTTERPEHPNMVWIQGGTFMMGSLASTDPELWYDEIPQHQVTVSSFYMGKYEVTQKEWREVMGTTVQQLRDKDDWLFNWLFIGGEGDNYPIYYVSWYDAIEYCNRRSQKEGLTPAYTVDKSRSDPNNKDIHDDVKWTVTWNRNANGYRLPTEAEWEYACRAGTTTPFSTGNNITKSQANYDGYLMYYNNAKWEFGGKTTPVGSFAPNGWGLYDMHGNVSEWCWDWYGDYSSVAQTDPMGAVSGVYRVLRGGSWCNSATSSASRYELFPSVRSVSGFRLVRP